MIGPKNTINTCFLENVNGSTADIKGEKYTYQCKGASFILGGAAMPLLLAMSLLWSWYFIKNIGNMDKIMLIYRKHMAYDTELILYNFQIFDKKWLKNDK